jgi:hypothetical protein
MTIRTEAEIQRAHDLLSLVLLDPVTGQTVDPNTQATMMHNLDVLCWVLHHDHNETFPKNLAQLEDDLARAGVTLQEYPDGEARRRYQS